MRVLLTIIQLHSAKITQTDFRFQMCGLSEKKNLVCDGIFRASLTFFDHRNFFLTFSWKKKHYDKYYGNDAGSVTEILYQIHKNTKIKIEKLFGLSLDLNILSGMWLFNKIFDLFKQHGEWLKCTLGENTLKVFFV